MSRVSKSEVKGLQMLASNGLLHLPCLLAFNDDDIIVEFRPLGIESGLDLFTVVMLEGMSLDRKDSLFMLSVERLLVQDGLDTCVEVALVLLLVDDGEHLFSVVPRPRLMVDSWADLLL
jgi:hypothetical protein